MISRMSAADESDARRPARLPLALVQRELVLILMLCGVSAALFAATRGLAEWARETSVATAAEWYARGEALAETGANREAVTWLRRAANADRGNLRYALMLARALAEAERASEAQRILERLREAYPDNVEINYRLARLHAAAGDDAAAVRHYNHAMYGLASFGADYERWRIRMELIRFLLDRGDRDGAVAELTALSRELPDTVGAHLAAARLSLEAGDHQRALAQFQLVRRLDPAHAEAATGAGDAAYALGDYAQALTHWDAAATAGADLELRRSQQRTAGAVLSRDPLARGLSRAERARRLAGGLAWARARLNGCAAAAAISDPATAGASLPDAVDALRQRPAGVLSDPDTLSAGLALILRVATAAAARCPSTDPVDQAWMLIARRAQA
jgi:tetratricopeptide (TPR) repeat protein